MLEFWLVLALLVFVGLLLCGGAVVARSSTRRRSRLLTDRRIAEERIDHMTVQTLQAMRQVVREHLGNQR